MVEREIEFLGEGLRRQVKALAVDIGLHTLHWGYSGREVVSGRDGPGAVVLGARSSRFHSRISVSAV